MVVDGRLGGKALRRIRTGLEDDEQVWNK